jgi:hypothetical protein
MVVTPLCSLAKVKENPTSHRLGEGAVADEVEYSVQANHA